MTERGQFDPLLRFWEPGRCGVVVDGAGPPRSRNRFHSVLRFCDRLIPDALLSADPDTRRRSRLVLSFALALAFWSPVFAVIYVYLGTPALATAVLLAGAAVLLVPVLLRTGSIVWPGHWLTLDLFLVLIYVSYHTDGIRSPAAPWFVAVPMVGTLLLGYRAGGGWLMASVGALAALYGAKGPDVSMLAAVSPENQRFLVCFALLGITIVIFSLTLIYEKLKDQAVAALVATDRAKSEFLANMSHELRTPLTAILGYADLLLDHGGGPPSIGDSRVQLQMIRRNGQHLLEVINDILDLSKIEVGKLIVESLKVSPIRLIDEVVKLMQVRADAEGIALEVHYDPSTPSAVYTDPTRLRQILFNLVGNAIKFTPAGSVRLEVRAPCGPNRTCRLEIDVVDTGIGIPPDHLQALFEPFTQEDGTSSRHFGGTGLGLAISRRLARMLGGDIRVESRLGHGSRFRLEVATEIGIPFADSELERSSHMCRKTNQPGDSSVPSPAIEASADRGSESTTGGEASLAGTHVLLAEDGPDNRLLIEHLLRKAGAEVTLVENGQAAVDRALDEARRGCPFDAILMDMQMPVLDGYAATAALRRAGYRAPIVALTAHAMEEDRRKCLAAGCDEYATKPIRRNELLGLLRKFTQACSTV